MDVLFGGMQYTSVCNPLFPSNSSVNFHLSEGCYGPQTPAKAIKEDSSGPFFFYDDAFGTNVALIMLFEQ